MVPQNMSDMRISISVDGAPDTPLVGSPLAGGIHNRFARQRARDLLFLEKLCPADSSKTGQGLTRAVRGRLALLGCESRSRVRSLEHSEHLVQSAEQCWT
jgi:hypothetical protein